MEKLIENRKYLVKRSLSSPLLVVVLNVTNTSYKFKYENDNTDWVEINEFERLYTVLEDVSEYEIKTAIKNIEFEGRIKYEKCIICHGEGTLPDSKSTAGKIICPYCKGSKLIVGNIDTCNRYH